MTVPLTCPSPAIDASAPRKRRRRAPASGAPDDCFACIKRNANCDRRRPYCSQCLAIGNECSGYKTQLTWGVGVASRGKLRGLSLPVAKSAPAAKSPPRSRARATSSVSRNGSVQGDRHEDDEFEVKLERELLMSAPSYTTYDFVNMVPNSPSLSGADWTAPMHEEHVRSSHFSPPERSQQHLLRQSLHRLGTPMHVRYGEDMHLSISTGSLSAYSDADYSPMAHSFTTEDAPYLASPMPLYSGFNSPVEQPSSYFPSDGRGPTSCPDSYYAHSDISSSIGSRPNMYEAPDGRFSHESPADISTYDDEIMAHMSNSLTSEQFSGTPQISKSTWTSAEDEHAAQAANENHLRSLSSADFFNIGLLHDISPRLGFYLNYYEKIICPVTVAIDSPSNPYRQQVLRLAVGSPSLQHAICALASCNLRMRRRQSLGQQRWRQVHEFELQDRVRTNSHLSSLRGGSVQSPSSDGPLNDASVQEEYRHRSQAVALLNQQLSDPSKAKDDAVLATLLMLCHYRMCESGVAQFKTQFAGVKKLLGMRSSGPETGNWGWMESMFTFFDAITATVNDREAQLRGGYLDMIACPSSDFALENLAGCDGQLFKTIATLGRLNLLSQHRPVLDPLKYTSLSRAPPPPPQPRPQLSGQALVEFYKAYSHNFDGNGFSQTLDDDKIMAPTSQHLTQPAFSGSDDEGSRAQFWQEWKETRQSLQNWEFDPQRLITALGSVTPSPDEIRDFGYVSEAFRYAALLYTERLACPTVSSSHLSFQNLVSQALFYITSLDGHEGSDAMGKFLLWPLFVVGSECISDVHQDIIRRRCREIGARGGYQNNLAGLEILEKIWKGEGDWPNTNGYANGSFRWNGLMDNVDGEYIMV